MSASLVGSEMCIRDSAQVERKLCASGGGATARRLRRWSKQRVELEVAPVSYTHLTLPTICSV
eukprot:2323995-Alexandrium_andersonii.AAC.1